MAVTPQPSAAIIDSRSVESAANVGRDDRRFDGGNYQGLDVVPGGADRPWPIVARQRDGRDNYSSVTFLRLSSRPVACSHYCMAP